MKLSKKLMAGFGTLLVVMAILLVPTLSLCTYADEGRMIIAISTGNAQVGQEVSITVTAHDNNGTSVTTDMKVTFDNQILSYTGSNANSASCEGNTITAKGKSITFKFTASSAGSCPIAAYGTTADGRLTAAGVRISVAGEAAPEPEPEPEPQPETQDPETNSKEACFEFDGVVYKVSNDYDAKLLNKGFQEVDVVVQEQTFKGLQYGDTNWVILYLVSAEDDTVNGHYLYDAETGVLCPYIGYAMNEDNAPVDGDELAAAQSNYSKLFDRYSALKETNRKLIVAVIAVVVVFALIMINVLIFRNINRSEEEDEYDDDYDDYDESEMIEQQGKYLEATASNSATKDVEETTFDLGSEISEIMKKEKSKESRKESRRESKKEKRSDESKDGLEIIDLEDL